MKDKFELAKEQFNPILRPCPYCGGQAQIYNYSAAFQENGSYIQCGSCGARSRKFTYVPYRLFITESQMRDTSLILSANAWNRKPDDTGTFGCPDCGVSIPHSHQPKDKYGTIIITLN